MCNARGGSYVVAQVVSYWGHHWSTVGGAGLGVHLEAGSKGSKNATHRLASTTTPPDSGHAEIGDVERADVAIRPNGYSRVGENCVRGGDAWWAGDGGKTS
jgi:hypothetical protein